jgi:hypothetical protein
MITKASIIVMSHLSDSQEELNMGLKHSVNSHINFAKYVILQTKGDLNTEIDADALWEAFMLTPYYKG